MEKYLEKIGNSLGLSECGRKWLIMALDPFNDNLDNHDGFPDGHGVKNLVEQVKSTYNITNSTNNTGTYDVLIVQLPWEVPVKMAASASQATGSSTQPNTPGNLLNEWGYQSSGASFQLGGVMVVCMPSANNNWNPQLGAWSGFVAANTGSVNSITPSGSYLQDNYRVTNKGFEVANTTAPLYRQGTVTLFKVPVASKDAAGVGNIATWTTGNVGSAIATGKVLNLDMWPESSSTAFLATNAIQHNAEDGVYMPAVINDLNGLTDYKYDPTVPFVVSATGENGIANCMQEVSSAFVSAPWPSFSALTGVEWSAFHMSGCLFQGLSPQTTLQLNVKWGIERFPSQNNSLLAPLAHDPPNRDTVALDLYNHIIQSMPVGCRFNDNGFGDWIADALGSAADFISPVLGVIPHPLAQAVSHGIRTADAVSNPGRAQAVQAKRLARQTAMSTSAEHKAKEKLDNQKIISGK
jgi:hypothetical protein